MAENKLQFLGNREHELKIGQSFYSKGNSGAAFHSIKYDFKPASVDVQKMAKVEVGSTNNITVTVPNVEGATVGQTVFRGNQKPYQKECVLIIDHNTGEITLERLNSNIQVKKTRCEGPSKLGVPRSDTPEAPSKRLSPQSKLSPHHSSAPTPPYGSSKPYCSPCVPRHSPLHASPPLPCRSPLANPQTSPNYPNAPTPVAGAAASATLSSPSLPIIGLDDGPPDEFPVTEEANEVGLLSLSDTSSDSSSDSASSDSEPETAPPQRPKTQQINGHTNGRASPAVAPVLSMPDHLLNDDLQLSESGSDSD
ncbi:ELL-associated factor 1 [Neocloeon triangulifer]|uniref:ELL-associated factor 1 n=1 Tax=Neocloeon triangulifer TaxID=2078957 RepID=UPI00286F0A3B|nr:ELL-associated factor 1 [Neocloeon triangulifer]